MLFSFIITINLIFGALAATNPDAKGCKVSLGSKQNFRYQRPLIFKTTGDLIPTKYDDKFVEIEDEENVLLSCGPNYLRNFGRSGVMKVKCDAKTNSFIADDGTSNDIEHFSCDLRVIEEVHAPVASCSNAKWTSTKFGLVQPLEDKTYILGESCYDVNLGSTVFTHFKLGKGNSVLEKVDKKFLVTGRHPDSRYKIDLFRSLAFDEIYQRMEKELQINNIIPLSLTNYLDEMLLENSQLNAIRKLGWNYFIKTDNQTSLDSIKESIRKLSEGMDLEIYTGGYGVATLYGSSNSKKMDVYLDATKKRFPMPKIIWFLVQSKSKSIAFAIYNNRNEIDSNQSLKNSGPICQSVCDQVTWLRNQQEFSGDDVLCCSYDDLRQSLTHLPIFENLNENLLL